MATKQPASAVNLKPGIIRLIRIHFVFVLTYATNIIISDSWNLIPADALMQRWTAAAAMLVVTTIIWYMVRNSAGQVGLYRNSLYALILLDILVAAFTVYTQRGMASRGVMLFTIPLIFSTLLASRSALLATASLSTAAYVLAAVKYFTDHPGEGYKVELYGEVGFYSALFFIFAALLWAIKVDKKA